jgi:hypothetical protein
MMMPMMAPPMMVPPMVVVMMMVMMVMVMVVMMVLSQNQRSFRAPLLLRPLGFSPQDTRCVGNRVQQF